MKLPIQLACIGALIFCNSAEAKIDTEKLVFQCGATSEVLNPGKVLNYTLSKDRNGFNLKVDGVKADEKVTVTSAKLNGLSDYLKCKSDDDKCHDAVTKSKDKGFSDFGTLIALARDTNSNSSLANEKIDRSLAQLNPLKIKSGKSYVFGNTTKFGGLGVYEFYDKGGALLGRYLYAVELMKCRDEAAPDPSDNKESGDATKSVK